MVKDFYYNIVNGLDVKENLLSLKETLKTPIKGSRERDALLLILSGDYSVFAELLKNEDPKIRKNTAIVLGILGVQDNIDILYEAYTTDTVMYNKASYVEAMRKIGYEKYKDNLKARFDELKKMPVDDENRKHVIDEMKQLIKIFGKDHASAEALMLVVHNKGRAAVGTYPYDIALTKIGKAMNLAKEKGFPFRMTVEEA